MPTIKRTAAPAPAPATTKREETPFEASTRLLEEYRARLLIDKDALDDMWVEHAGLVNDVGNQYSLAQSYRDEADAFADEEVARADGYWRRELLKNGKPTEAEIKSHIALDENVKSAQVAQRSWKVLASQWGNLVKSFDSRQYALRTLSSLWERSYWVSNSHKGMPESTRDRIAGEVRRSQN